MWDRSSRARGERGGSGRADISISNGQDELQFMAAVQAAVNQALDERDRAAGARSRSALYDRD